MDPTDIAIKVLQETFQKAISQSGEFEDALAKLYTQASSFIDVIQEMGPAVGQFAADVTKTTAASVALLAVEEASFAFLTKATTATDVFLKETQRLAKGSLDVADEVMRVTGLGPAAFEALNISVESSGRKFSENAYKIVSDIGAAEIEYMDSQGGIQRLQQVRLGSAADQMKLFTETLINDTRLYKFAMEGANKEIVTDIKMTQETLKLNSRDINLIFQNELSETGKITGEFLDKFQEATLAVVRMTSLAPEKVSAAMIEIMRNFETFGDISEERAASLVVTMNNLGIEIDDVTRVAGKFQSFDSATQAMSQLAAVTGVTLDTLELFRLANEDPEMFVVSLREQLQAQGLEFEELNLIQQKQISSAFGLDPRIMQRLMNENIDAITGASLGIDDFVEKTTEEEANRMLGALLDINKLAKEQTAEIAKRQSEAESASAAIAEGATTAAQAVTKLNGEALKALGSFRDTAITVKEGIISSAEELSSRFLGVTVTAPVSPVQTTAAPSSPGVTAAPSPPASGTPAGTPAAAPSSPMTIQSTAEVTVRGDGTALADALAPMIAFNLMNGVTVSGDKVTFVTKEPTA